MVFTMDRNRSGSPCSICSASRAGSTLLDTAIALFSFDLEVRTRRITRRPSSFHDATPTAWGNSYTTAVDVTWS